MKPKITNRNIEKLMRELMPNWATTTKVSKELDESIKAHEEVERSLMKNPKLVAWQERIDELRKQHENILEKRRKELAKIRKRYWAEGATPRVVEALTKMLDEED